MDNLVLWRTKFSPPGCLSFCLAPPLMSSLAEKSPIGGSKERKGKSSTFSSWEKKVWETWVWAWSLPFNDCVTWRKYFLGYLLYLGSSFLWKSHSIANKFYPFQIFPSVFGSNCPFTSDRNMSVSVNFIPHRTESWAYLAFGICLLTFVQPPKGHTLTIFLWLPNFVEIRKVKTGSNLYIGKSFVEHGFVLSLLLSGSKYHNYIQILNMGSLVALKCIT